MFIALDVMNNSAPTITASYDQTHIHNQPAVYPVHTHDNATYSLPVVHTARSIGDLATRSDPTRIVAQPQEQKRYRTMEIPWRDHRCCRFPHAVSPMAISSLRELRAARSYLALTSATIPKQTTIVNPERPFTSLDQETELA